MDINKIAEMWAKSHLAFCPELQLRSQERLKETIKKAIAEATAWRPIEEAPKDGTHIQAINFGDRGFGCYGDSCTVVHYFTNHGEEGFCPSVSEYEAERPFIFTHWRHIMPPAAGEGE